MSQPCSNGIVWSGTYKLVVLANDLSCALGEVESERCLVRTEVVDVENELLGKVLRVPPDDPTDTGVNKAILGRLG